MQRSRFSVVLFLLSIVMLGQNPGVRAPGQTTDQAVQERQFLARRENFSSGRELLLGKRVPFDPDELLRDGWVEKLKPVLDGMPEMHKTRYETAPLKGAYLADTLYLPERVEVTGHTIIVANYVVFEGKTPTIRGNYDIHFFPARPVAVLGTTLSEALQKRSGEVKVRFKGRFILPSFSLIKNVAQPGPHVITIDASGPKDQTMKKPQGKPLPELRTASWNLLVPPAFLQKQCSSSCDNNGDNGLTGSVGQVGTAAMAGASPPKAQNGSCAGIFNGIGGDPGGDGENGGAGGTGGIGELGHDSAGITAVIPDNDVNKYVFNANGGDGGRGGDGGPGANGGNGGRGGDGGDGVACKCQLGEGGDAGHGGNGGKGGGGGNGGNGNNGGRGGTITVSLPFNGTAPDTSRLGGHGGGVGIGGTGGQGGNFGIPGNPGKGATDCGSTAVDGRTSFAGSPGAPGPAGNAGTATGQNGPPGPEPSITWRTTTTSGGGGGGGECDQFLGGEDGLAPLQSCGDTSPIIIDTEGEGFHLTSAANGVWFDIRGDGHPIQIAWTASGSHNAFLALDRNGDGKVSSGKELFGNFSPQPKSSHPNGFLALAQFDKPENGGNGDGVIDDKDAVFSRLRLWIDENHDGLCQSGELHTLPELGVFSLALKYVELRRRDDFGNQFRYRAKVNPDPSDGESDVGRWTYDVFLTTTNR